MASPNNNSFYRRVEVEKIRVWHRQRDDTHCPALVRHGIGNSGQHFLCATTPQVADDKYNLRAFSGFNDRRQPDNGRD